MKLYRPVGLRELELICESGWRALPPRLFHQPIFHPVLSFACAEAIARNWNTDNDASGHAGFVTSFDVNDDFVSRHDVQVVGGSEARELWVPAEELDEFNRHIVGRINVEASFHGAKFTGERDEATGLPRSVSGPGG